MSAFPDERPSARLGDVVFEFEYPLLNSKGAGIAAKHEILPTSESDDAATVIQPLGREARQWTLRGDCYEDTASTLDNIIGEVVHLRHPRHSGQVYVEDVSTEPQGVFDEGGRWYTYNIPLTEVV